MFFTAALFSLIPMVGLMPASVFHGSSSDKTLTTKTPSIHYSGTASTKEAKSPIPVSCFINGLPLPFLTTSADVAGVIADLGINLNPEDYVFPPLSSPTSPCLNIVLNFAQPIKILVDGQEMNVHTRAATVGGALDEHNVTLQGLDRVEPTADGLIGSNAVIRVVRVMEETKVIEAEVPFEVIEEPDPILPEGRTEVRQEGVLGLEEQTVRIHYEDGQETDRVVLDRKSLREPQPQRVAYGTGPKSMAGEQLTVWATSYTAAESGSPGTALGIPARYGVIAVDPDIIPLGTRLYVPGYGEGIAADTGGLVKGYVIDLCFNDEGPFWWTSQYVTITILGP